MRIVSSCAHARWCGYGVGLLPLLGSLRTTRGHEVHQIVSNLPCRAKGPGYNAPTNAAMPTGKNFARQSRAA
jgi:hypothetical protein